MGPVCLKNDKEAIVAVAVGMSRKGLKVSGGAHGDPDCMGLRRPSQGLRGPSNGNDLTYFLTREYTVGGGKGKRRSRAESVRTVRK